MARIHSRTKGKSGSTKPIEKDFSYAQLSIKETEKKIIEMAKDGITSSKIGLILRDSFVILDVKGYTSKSITTIIKEGGISLEIPEDISSLKKKYQKLKKHLEANNRDIHNKRSLILTRSKILRLMKYYKRKNVLPKSWGFEN